MTAIINNVTVFGSPDEILRLMQLAGKTDYQYGFTGIGSIPIKIDPKVPKNEIWFGDNGENGKITNIIEPKEGE